MLAHSLDLRESIVKSWQQGQSKSAIARLFMMNLGNIKRYITKFTSEGHVRPIPQRRMQGKLNKQTVQTIDATSRKLCVLYFGTAIPTH